MCSGCPVDSRGVVASFSVDESAFQTPSAADAFREKLSAW